MSKLRTCAAVLVLFAPALSSVASAQPSRRPRQVVVKKEGWLVPGRDYFRKQSRVAEVEIEGVAVTHKILEAPAEIFVDAEGHRVEPFAGRRSDVQLLAVRGFSAYESNGRVFAYGVDLVPVFVIRGKNYRELSYAGAMHNLFYVDENSDGVFETRFTGRPLPVLPERLRRNN